MNQRVLKDGTWFDWDAADEYRGRNDPPWGDPLYRTRHDAWVYDREVVSKAFAARWFVHRGLRHPTLVDDIAALEV